MRVSWYIVAANASHREALTVELNPEQPDGPAGYPVHCRFHPMCEGQDLRMRGNVGTYWFKHFPLGLDFLLMQCILPGLTELPGKLLIHRWLGRMTAQCATKWLNTKCAKSQSADGGLWCPRTKATLSHQFKHVCSFTLRTYLFFIIQCLFMVSMSTTHLCLSLSANPWLPPSMFTPATLYCIMLSTSTWFRCVEPC